VGKERGGGWGCFAVRLGLRRGKKGQQNPVWKNWWEQNN